MSKNRVQPVATGRSYMDITRAMSLAGSNLTAIEILQTTDDSKARQVGKMILVILIPVAALIAKASISFSESLSTSSKASGLGDVIKHALYASEGVNLLQRERGLTAIYLGAEEGDFKAYRDLASARLESNEFLLTFTVYRTIHLRSTSKPMETGADLLAHLNAIRDLVDLRVNITMLDIIEQYTEVNLALMQDSLRVSLVPSKQDIWPLVVSFDALTRAVDTMGTQRGIGGAAFSACRLTVKERSAFQVLNAKRETLLNTSFTFLPELKAAYEANYSSSHNLYKMLARQKRYIVNNSALAELCQVIGRGSQEGRVWFSVASQFMELLSNLQRRVSDLIRTRIPVVEAEAQRGMAVYLSIIIVVTVTCLMLSVWYSFRLNAMNSRVREAVLKVRERSDEVKEEKKKTDFLLYQMMPQRVANALKSGMEVVPEWFDSVTIYFSDIFDWAELSIKSSPHQIVTLLNDLYKSFDEIIEKYEVYKVETIADSYMCVSGLPEKNPKHAKIIAKLALEMIRFAKTFTISHLPGVPLSLRIGFHSGSCVAGVVGTKMPRYCLFGDTVNTASRMETNGEALKIHISEASKKLLEKLGGFHIEFRGNIAIKEILHPAWFAGGMKHQQGERGRKLLAGAIQYGERGNVHLLVGKARTRWYAQETRYGLALHKFLAKMAAEGFEAPPTSRLTRRIVDPLMDSPKRRLPHFIQCGTVPAGSDQINCISGGKALFSVVL